MKPTRKSSKKPKYDAKRALAIKQVAEEFECTTSYVRGVILGTFKNENADEILKRYNKLYGDLVKLLPS